MDTTPNHIIAVPGVSRVSNRFLDLLAEAFVSDSGVARHGSDFVTSQPWGLADFGKFTLRRGWWTFECEGEGDVGAVELRLFSPEDTLLAFSLRRAAKAHVLFYTDKTFDVSLLPSAWPGRVHLSTLRLRRLSGIETVRLAGAMTTRLLRSSQPLSRLRHAISRAVGGRSLRIQPLLRETSGRVPLRISADAAGAVRTVTSAGLTVMLREDEQLHPSALEVVGNAFARSKSLQVVYADLAEGERIRPRPGWDPDLAEAAAYVDTPVFFRDPVEIADKWERLCALSTLPGAVARIALPLASRGTAIGKTFAQPQVPSLSFTPLVSVIIPTKIKIDLLERCLAGLADRTGYPKLEVVIVDNGASCPRFSDVLAGAASKLRVRKLEDLGSFNFSRLINLGVRNSKGEVVLLLNDDTEPQEEGWLHRIVESVLEPGVGCVGARLLYPDRTIQHAGVMLGLSGVCGHLWKGLREEEAREIPQVVLPSGRMAVTGACLAIRRELFDQVGGLDEDAFPVAFNDLDLCLRVRALGFRTVYRGDAVLIHHESQSRGQDDETLARRKRLSRETRAFLSRWGHLLSKDPFGSPGFDPTVESGATHPSLRNF